MFHKADFKCYVNARKQTHLYLIIFSIHSLCASEYPNYNNVSLYWTKAANKLLNRNVENYLFHKAGTAATFPSISS